MTQLMVATPKKELKAPQPVNSAEKRRKIPQPTIELGTSYSKD